LSDAGRRETPRRIIGGKGRCVGTKSREDKKGGGKDQRRRLKNKDSKDFRTYTKKM